MKRIILVVIAIIRKGDRFLLTKRRGMDPDDRQFGSVWHFPGGALEFGENIQDALMREIKEETSLTITVDRLLPRIHSAVRDNWHGVLLPHLCSIVGPDTIVLDHESQNYGWFTLEEIKNLKKLPYVMEMAEDAAMVTH